MSTCSHCYMEVMIKSDGTCPACRRSQDGAVMLAADKCMAVIEFVHRMPPFCLVCGENTQRIQKFTFKYDVVESKTFFTRLMARLPGNERRKAQRTNLPICDNCVPSANLIEPLSIRFDLDMRMVVHKNFRAKLYQLNGPIKAEPT